MNRGRPTKYKPEYCEAIVAFIKAGGEPVLKYPTVGDPFEIGRLPAHLSAFARSIGVCHDTILEWCKEHPDFSESYKIAKEIQLEHMVNGAMRGIFETAPTIFALKNMHKWTDKTDVNQSNSGTFRVEYHDFRSDEPK